MNSFTESEEGDLDHDFYEGDTVDISGYLRELIAINIPFNIICGNDNARDFVPIAE